MLNFLHIEKTAGTAFSVYLKEALIHNMRDFVFCTVYGKTFKFLYYLDGKEVLDEIKYFEVSIDEEITDQGVRIAIEDEDKLNLTIHDVPNFYSFKKIRFIDSFIDKLKLPYKNFPCFIFGHNLNYSATYSSPYFYNNLNVTIVRDPLSRFVSEFTFAKERQKHFGIKSFYITSIDNQTNKKKEIDTFDEFYNIRKHELGKNYQLLNMLSFLNITKRLLKVFEINGELQVPETQKLITYLDRYINHVFITENLKESILSFKKICDANGYIKLSNVLSYDLSFFDKPFANPKDEFMARQDLHRQNKMRKPNISHEKILDFMKFNKIEYEVYNFYRSKILNSL